MKHRRSGSGYPLSCIPCVLGAHLQSTISGYIVREGRPARLLAYRRALSGVTFFASIFYSIYRMITVHGINQDKMLTILRRGGTTRHIRIARAIEKQHQPSYEPSCVIEERALQVRQNVCCGPASPQLHQPCLRCAVQHTRSTCWMHNVLPKAAPCHVG